MFAKEANHIGSIEVQDHLGDERPLAMEDLRSVLNLSPQQSYSILSPETAGQGARWPNPPTR